jgi:hypothetical protein
VRNDERYLAFSPVVAGAFLEDTRIDVQFLVNLYGTLVPGAMVAEVPCNLTPRHPPRSIQVVDNLPRYGS